MSEGTARSPTRVAPFWAEAGRRGKILWHRRCLLPNQILEHVSVLSSPPVVVSPQAKLYHHFFKHQTRHLILPSWHMARTNPGRGHLTFRKRTTCEKHFRNAHKSAANATKPENYSGLGILESLFVLSKNPILVVFFCISVCVSKLWVFSSFPSSGISLSLASSLPSLFSRALTAMQRRGMFYILIFSVSKLFLVNTMIFLKANFWENFCEIINRMCKLRNTLLERQKNTDHIIPLSGAAFFVSDKSFFSGGVGSFIFIPSTL